jgi:tetratricopeptide (TPR) repeat protein
MTESYEEYIRAGNRMFTIMSLEYISLVHFLLGDLHGSIQVYDNYIAGGSGPIYLNRKGDRLIRLGSIELAQGRYKPASDYYEEALVYGQQNHHDGFVCEAYLELARTAWAQGEVSLAGNHLQESIQAAQAYDSKGLIARVYSEMGRIAMAQGDFRAAQVHIQQALPLFQMPFFRWAAVLGLEVATALAAQTGEYERTAQFYGAAGQMAGLTRDFHSPAEWAQLGDSARQAQAALGLEAFEQLRTEGQELGLQQTILKAIVKA